MFGGILLALAAAAAWAHNSIVYTFSGRRVSSGTTAHIRLWVALPVSLMLHLLLRGQLFPQAAGTGSFLAASLSGILGYVIADLFIFSSYVRIGPRDTMLIMTTSPVFSSVLGIVVYGEMLGGWDIAASLIILSGIALVVFDVPGRKKPEINRELYELSTAPVLPLGEEPGGLPERAGMAVPGSQGEPEAEVRPRRTAGIVSAFAGSLAQALGLIFSKFSIEAGDHPVEVNVMRLTAGLAALALYLLVRGRFTADFRKMRDRTALALISFGALVGPSLGVLSSLYAVMYIPVGLAAVLMQTTPVMLLPVERLVFKRHISLRAISGTLLSLGGIALLILL